MNRLLKFFKRKVLLTHAYGTPVRIDYRWFLFLLIMAWMMMQSIPDDLVENGLSRFLFGLITTFIFFGTIFLHELAHAFVARREGIRVVEILLHPFGGLARLGREPDNPGTEFRIAIAGPIASFLISFAFLGLFAVSKSLDTAILSPLFFLLFLLNFLLAIFNLFPGYPLDGGRGLRAILWKRGADLNEATILTGKFGQIIAISLVVLGGVVIIINGDVFTGLWTILVGIFLFDAASGIIRDINNYEDLLVENIMELAISVSPASSVMEFVDNILPLHRQILFPVAADKQLYGFLVLEDLKKNLKRELWQKTKVKEVMRRIQEDYFLESDASVVEARQLMQVNGLGALGVVDSKGQLVGFVQQGRLGRKN